MKPATEVNEIWPRSRSRDAVFMPQNRVPMCRTCHEAYHHDGVTTEKMRELHDIAEQRLIAFGADLEKW